MVLICFLIIGLLVGVASGIGKSYFVSSYTFLCGSTTILLEGSFTSVEYLCFIMLFICGALSLLFSKHYFSWESNSLNSLIVLFLLVMGVLILTNDLFSSLVLWEYLGFVSFLLILYYANYDTCYAGNTTLITSRFGDVGLFLVCSCIYNSLGVNSSYFIMFSLLCVITTKSAVIPFSSWLLEAMRAPTPVSCLVHSSTLVAAGVWFLTNYGTLFGSGLINSLIILSLLSVWLSARCALFFFDVKKIVALSTCNNIAWCILYYLLGFKLLCVVQLVSHGIGKCLLFMGVGDALAGSYSSQNKHSLMNYHYNSNAGWLFTSLLVLLVAGIPFNGVFFTKHLLLSGEVYQSNLFVLGGLFYCVYLSYLYSGRLVFLISPVVGGLSNSIHNVFYLGSFCVMLCSVANYWLSSVLVESNELDILSSVLISASQLFGLYAGFQYSIYKAESGWYNVFGGQDVIIKKVVLYWGALVNNILPLSHVRWEFILLDKFVYLASGTPHKLSYGGAALVISILLIIVLN
uniref:NADH:ubiquinone reductase (H(+)-translocating) n=1 Tax=Euryhaliotrema johni TaxID=2849187 RepID=A0A8F2Q750_9PLAT|nr:NADH dehydrogenase subunit 5 [Euryhaliotrema johni]